MPAGNILICNKASFSKRVACCTDFIRVSWQPVEASCKEFCKTSVLKIPTNRRAQPIVYAKAWEIPVIEFVCSIFQLKYQLL